tara:strand:+ start:7936 stop:9561 length:1626 start_codon:yes stop_codon:yes gene_type:complete
MPNDSYFMGQDGFVWFVGVVEDRNDPDKLGRVRVRCLGFHTPDLTEIPTSELPWAHVMHPVTDPCMHGLGNTPSFLVEGAWVVGFFRDAIEKQQPVIIGALPGIPAYAADYRKGFNDPRNKKSTQKNDADKNQYAYDPGPTKAGFLEYGPYPLDGKTFERPPPEPKATYTGKGHQIGESDTNRLARGVASEDHPRLQSRRERRRTKIPIATRPYLKRTQLGAEAEPIPTWNEPHPKSVRNAPVPTTTDHVAIDKKNGAKVVAVGGSYVDLGDGDPIGANYIPEIPYPSSRYPYNHVYESEAGHIFEIDDTVGRERLHREHSSGTFEEIHPDGTKMVKVVGDNYEIVAGKSNILVSGNVNLTVEGTMRQLVMGDYILEVQGNYTEKIGKNHRVRVGYTGIGNREEEINDNYSYIIGNNMKGTIGSPDDVNKEGNVVTLIKGNEVRSIGGYFKANVKGVFEEGKSTGISIFTDRNFILNSKEDLSITTISGIVSIQSGSELYMRSADKMDINCEKNDIRIWGSDGDMVLWGSRIDLNETNPDG